MTARPAPRRRTVGLLACAALLLPVAAVAAPAAAAAPPVTQAAAAAVEPPSRATVAGLQVENSFVSSTGWVKPGELYPSQLRLTNTTGAPVTGVSVTIPSPRGTSLLAARAAVGSARANVGTVTWALDAPVGTTVLILEARAATLEQEPTLVWRNLSTQARVTVGAASTTVASHGPKVIPPNGGYETARYGDRPFPVVPVDYLDTKHDADNPADEIEGIINDPANPGSTFNLFQEMSFGQLHPRGALGSLASKGAAPKAEDGLVFSTVDPAQTSTCVGAAPAVNPATGVPTPAYAQRVSDDGWYQMPYTRGYYGSDANGSAVVGSLAGVGALQAIDSGCGPTAKLAYDAAVASDPDIDFNDFDTDKDGLVDFFEVIFEGCGGNGASQLSVAADCPPQDTGDNVWPHSSSLEFSYADPTTGLTGYTSKDRLEDLEGAPLFYTDDTYTKTTTATTAFPAFVRVGPYNVNPETALEFASVISHEYGHSLGLPDYYSTGGRDTYGDLNLMATDKSHHMDVIGKKEMGWIVPEVVAPGTSTVEGWKDSKVDTGRISWVTPSGQPYVLSAAGGDYGVHNGQAYAASLPGRELIDPDKVSQGASGKQVWYSRQGNDFGCPPTGGHNLDFAIPGLADVPAGTPITATFKSFFDIEWDYDYGFVLVGQPGEQGKVAYTSQESANGYTTPATQNPNANSCQAALGNGITGTPASYDSGMAAVDRVAGNYPDGPFVEDEYDLSELAGVEGGVLRFSYATDPGFAKLGWLIDDLVVTAGDEVLFESDFEDGDGGPDDPRVYPGGCKEDLSTSGGLCTEGWSYLAAGTPSELEHGYLLEMRDRSGFDFDGGGEADRGAPEFEPGLLLTYTDEAHGYGNVGTDNPPAQSPLDSVPSPESDTPDLNDATFVPRSTEAVPAGPLPGEAEQPAVDRSRFSDAAGDPHLDNYSEPTRDADKTQDPDGDGVQPWTFDYNCLGFQVTSMTGDTVPPALTADTAQDVLVAGRSAFDLSGDVAFTRGSGCAPFNYGVSAEGAAPVVAPQPTAQACPAGRVPTPVRDYERNTHEAAIDCMVWWEVAQGRTPSQYVPLADVTREQMASFVARLVEKAGGTLPAGADAFRDDAGSVHEANIDKLAAAGIVSGRSDGSFGPKERVTRGQMAKFLVGAYELVSPGELRPVGDYFPDDEGSVFEVFIDKAAAGGFTQGRSDGRYAPLDPVRRDAMASFLARALGLLVTEGTTPPKA